jgi:ribosomal protein S3/plasmid maintenance system killer protein
MGQKINSNIFRLGIKKTEWKSKYFENTKEEFSLYAYQSLKIKQFLQKFLTNNGSIFHDFKLQYSGNTIYLFISYYITFKTTFLLNKISTQQKFKLKKHNFYRKLKRKVKKKQFLIKKQDFKLQKLFFPISSNINNQTKKNLKNKIIRKFKDKKIKSFVQKKFKKRIKILNNSRNNLKIMNYRSIELLKLNHFSEQLLESLSIYINKKFNLFIIFQNLNKKLSLKLTKIQAKFLKKELLALRRESQNKFFKETVNVLVISVIKKNSAQLLAELIAYQLSINKRHNFFLIFVKRFLITLVSEAKFSNVSGVKFTIKGRFNGVSRARKRIYETGKIPIQTIDSNISYYEATSYTPNGTFGVKVWICKR